MSSNRLRFDGLAELRSALRSLPADLAREGSGIVLQRADEARGDIKNAYPEVSGDLKGKVTLVTKPSDFGSVAIVKSAAKHAFIFENGTQARHTDLGYNRGAMPAANIFVPMVVRKRRAMNIDLVNLLKRAGLQVREN